jgi:hypothetical protein
MEEFSLFQILSGIINLIILIVFFVLAVNISKILKQTSLFTIFYLSMEQRIML